MATLLLKPKADGSSTTWTATGDHYDDVDDSTTSGGHDSDTSYVSATGAALDYFTADIKGSPPGTITAVKVSVTAKTVEDSFPSALKNKIKLGASTGTQSWPGDATTSYVTVETTISRPGGGSWTWQDIYDLEFGYESTGVGTDEMRVTQVFLTVEYEPATAWDPGLLGVEIGIYDDQSTRWTTTSRTSSPTDGQGVAMLDDRSGNDFHYAQPTSTREPTHKADYLNGLPVLEFPNPNGNDNFFMYLGNNAYTGDHPEWASGGKTFVYLLKLKTDNDIDRFMMKCDDGTARPYLATGSGWGGSPSGGYGQLPTGGSWQDSGKTLGTTDWKMITWRLGATNGNRIDVNGVEEYSVSGTDEDLDMVDSGDQIWLGGAWGAFADFYLAAHLLIDDDVSDADLDKILGLYLHRFGLQSLLPASHTYEYEPPQADPVTDTATLDGLLQATKTKTATLDALLQATKTNASTLDGLLQTTGTQSGTIDGLPQPKNVFRPSNDVTIFWSRSSGGKNYTVVDDLVNEESEADYVYCTNTLGFSTTFRDIYHLEDRRSLINVGDISEVKITGRVKRGADRSDSLAYFGFRISASDYLGSSHALTTSYQTKTSTWATNPHTGERWEWTDLDDLQLLLDAELPTGTAPLPGEVYCAWIRVEVTYEQGVTTIPSGLDAWLQMTQSQGAALDAVLQATLTRVPQLDALLQAQGVTEPSTLDGLLQGTTTTAAAADALLKPWTILLPNRDEDTNFSSTEGGPNFGAVDGPVKEPVPVTFRPNAVVDINGIDNSSNWTAVGAAQLDEAVDDVSSDEDTTYITGPVLPYMAAFSLGYTTADRGPITQVRFVIRARSTSGSPVFRFHYGFSDAGPYNWNSQGVTGSYADYEKLSTINLKTGQPWTWEDIQALRMGVSTASGSILRVTQMFVEITYRPWETSVNDSYVYLRSDDGVGKLGVVEEYGVQNVPDSAIGIRWVQAVVRAGRINSGTDHEIVLGIVDPNWTELSESISPSNSGWKEYTLRMYHQPDYSSFDWSTVGGLFLQIIGIVLGTYGSPAEIKIPAAYLEVSVEPPVTVPEGEQYTYWRHAGMNALLVHARVRESSLDAMLQAQGVLRPALLDALLLGIVPHEATLDALLQEQGVLHPATLDALLQVLGELRPATLDALLQEQGLLEQSALDALLQEQGAVQDATLDGLLQATVALPALLDALLQDGYTSWFALDALLQQQDKELEGTLDAWLQQQGLLRSGEISAVLRATELAPSFLDGLLQAQGQLSTATLDGLAQKTDTVPCSLDALLKEFYQKLTASLGAVLVDGWIAPRCPAVESQEPSFVVSVGAEPVVSSGEDSFAVTVPADAVVVRESQYTVISREPEFGIEVCK